MVGLLVAMEGILGNLALMGQEKSIFKFHAYGFGVLNYAIRSVVVFVVLVLLVFGLLSVWFEEFFGVLLFPWLLLLIVSVFFQSFARLLMAHSRMIEDMRLFWRTRLFYQAVKSVLVLLCIWYTESGIGYVLAAVVSGLLFAVIFRTQLLIAVRSRDAWRASKNYATILLFGAPLLFHAMSGNILSYADRFFLEGYLDMRSLGVYTFVYSVGSSIFFFYGAVASYFEPLAYRYQHDVDKYRAVLRFYLLFVLVFALFASIIIDWAFRPLILPLVSHDYLEGALCLKFILAAHLLIPFHTIANYELAIRAKTHVVAATTLFSAGINLVLNAVLIPEMGLEGAAVATLITYGTLSLVTHLCVGVMSVNSPEYWRWVLSVFSLVLFIVVSWYFAGQYVVVSVCSFVTAFVFLLYECRKEYVTFHSVVRVVE